MVVTWHKGVGPLRADVRSWAATRRRSREAAVRVLGWDVSGAIDHAATRYYDAGWRAEAVKYAKLLVASGDYQQACVTGIAQELCGAVYRDAELWDFGRAERGEDGS